MLFMFLWLEFYVGWGFSGGGGFFMGIGEEGSFLRRGRLVFWGSLGIEWKDW